MLISFSIKNKKLKKSNDEIEGLKQVFNVSEDYILILNENKKVIYANEAALKHLNLKLDKGEVAFKKYPKIKIKKEWIPLQNFYEQVKVKSKESMLSFLQIEMMVDEERVIPVNFYINEKESVGEVISIHDLTKENAHKEAEHRHKVTNLPNQTQAISDLNALYAKTHLKNDKMALILIDIDNFSKLRSLLGYHQTNKIMVKLAKFLVTQAGQHDMKVYHTYPNIFLLTMMGVEDTQSVLDFVEKIQSALKEFYKVKEIHLHLSASVGISIYPDSGTTRNLLDNAYKALAEAQTHGHGQVHVYIPEKKRFAVDDLTLHSEMPKALENKEFEVFYQPIVDSKTHEVASAEALIRWIHPVHGMIPPDAFIPIMEQTGFIIELGKFILDEVIRQQKRWEIFQFKPVKVSINASMIEFERDNFVDEVEKKLRESKVDPELVGYEVTEGLAMISEKHTLEEFKRLQKLGVSISLDDFGTGYTSFSYLKKFPANTLKIDKSLVDYILESKEDQRIVQAMIELAHSLELKVVVEGIENKQMADLLYSYGCDLFQGYYFSRPLPLNEFQRLMRKESLEEPMI
jgi:polar amino acid transport system substrate-binding protein